MKPHSYLLFFLISWHCYANAQNDKLAFVLAIDSGQQEVYHYNDKVQITITARQTGIACADGITKVKLFAKGLRIEQQTPWAEREAGQWQKQVLVTVNENKQGKHQLTAYRKTDAGTVVKSIQLKVSKHD